MSWYGEPGYDASIFTPSADFRFLNDTGHYLLVKPEVDTKQGRITFHIYGTKPDRVVEAEKSVITNQQPAPKPLYLENPDLPAGKIKQVDWAKEGMDVTVKRLIKYADGRVKDLERYTREDFQFLAQSGLDWIFVGVENTSPRLMRLFNKNSVARKSREAKRGNGERAKRRNYS